MANRYKQSENDSMRALPIEWMDPAVPIDRVSQGFPCCPATGLQTGHGSAPGGRGNR
jgi:hypothetical protein